MYWRSNQPFLIFRLDISFNNLDTFKFSIFDQVGSATALKVNASYNRIITLTDSNAPSFFTSNFYPPPKAQSKSITICIITIMGHSISVAFYS